MQQGVGRFNARLADESRQQGHRGRSLGRPGRRIHDYVRNVWDVDQIGVHLRACLDLPPAITPSRKPLCTVINSLLYAPSTGRLVSLPVDDRPRTDGSRPAIDLEVEVGEPVSGPQAVFAMPLAEVSVTAKNLKAARAVLADVLRDPPLVEQP